MATTRITFEKETCTRCGGSGRMPFSVRGGICFKCQGNGQALTSNGLRAYRKVEAYGDAHLTVAASTVKVGDRIADEGRFRTVTAVEVKLGKGNGTSRTGVAGTDTYVETWTVGETTISTKSMSFAYPAHYPVRLAWTAEAIEAAAELVKNMKGAVLASS